MKKSGLLKILGVGIPLFFATQFANGQTIINRTNNYVDETKNEYKQFTKQVKEDNGTIFVDYTDSTFVNNNGQKGELKEVDNRQITDHKGDGYLLDKKDILAIQQTQPGQFDIEGNPVVSNYVFQNKIVTNNNTNESLKQVTDKEIKEYTNFLTEAQEKHKNNNLQKTFLNEVDMSGKLALEEINKYVRILEREKNLPVEEKTIKMVGPSGDGPKVTRGIAEELYLVDLSGNKRTYRQTENSVEIVIEDVGKDPITLVSFLNDGNKSYYKFNGELTEAKPGNNYMNAEVYQSAGPLSKEDIEILTRKYFNEANFQKINDRIEALKTNKVYMDPDQEF